MTYTLHPELIGTDTPKDYHRIHFDPVDIPAKRIVGLLACQRGFEIYFSLFIWITAIGK